MESTARLLIVDELDAIRRSLRREILRPGTVASFEIRDFPTAAAALESVGEVAYHAAILELRLFGPDGAAVAQAFRKADPEFPLLFLSAEPIEDLRKRHDLFPGAQLLPKPWSRDAVRVWVLEQYWRRRDGSAGSADSS